MNFGDILNQVNGYDHELVLVTGGEPLAQRECIQLLQILIDSGRRVQLETSGAIDISNVPDGVSIILDIKTPASGEEKRNRWQNLPLLKKSDEIKVVVCNRKDYEWARARLFSEQVIPSGLPVLFSPAWNMLNPVDLIGWILEDHLPVRVQLQLHKYVWGGEATGV